MNHHTKSENFFKTEQDVYEAAQQALDGMKDMTAEEQAKYAKEIIKLVSEYLSKDDHIEVIKDLQETVDEW